MKPLNHQTRQHAIWNFAGMYSLSLLVILGAIFWHYRLPEISGQEQREGLARYERLSGALAPSDQDWRTLRMLIDSYVDSNTPTSQTALKMQIDSLERRIQVNLNTLKSEDVPAAAAGPVLSMVETGLHFQGIIRRLKDEKAPPPPPPTVDCQAVQLELQRAKDGSANMKAGIRDAARRIDAETTAIEDAVTKIRSFLGNKHRHIQAQIQRATDNLKQISGEMRGM